MKQDRFTQQHKPLNESSATTFYVMWEGVTYPMKSRDYNAVMADVADASEQEDGAHTIFARTPDGDVAVSIWEHGMGRLTKAGQCMEAEGRARCEQEQDRPFNGLEESDIRTGQVRWVVYRNLLSGLGGRSTDGAN